MAAKKKRAGDCIEWKVVHSELDRLAADLEKITDEEATGDVSAWTVFAILGHPGFPIIVARRVVSA